jgi:glycosyltransferase involved in cell wall biosynthesis
MAERNLLVVTYDFPPSASAGTFRMLGLARHLPAFGWRAVVVAPPSLPWEPTDENLTREVPPDIPCYRPEYPRGFLTKVARRLFGPNPVWLPRALGACWRALREQPIDAILTSGPPHVVHLIGLALARRRGLPWIADFRDPWIPRGPVGVGWRPPGKWVLRFERWVAGRADFLVANAPQALQQFQAAYPERREHLALVTNGFDPERFDPSPPPAEGPVTLLYTGELYWGRDPRAVLDALRLIRQEGSSSRPIHAAFLGRNTEGLFDLAGEVRKRGLEEAVTLGGQVPYAQCLREMTRAGILLLLDTPNKRVGVPAKVYEYLGAGRPILALSEPDSDTAWVLRESGVPHRIFAPPGDPAALRSAILELAGDLQAGRSAAPAERLERFTRRHVAGEIAGLLDRCLQPGQSAGMGSLRRAETAGVRP